MVAPAVEGIDLCKIAGRSISGWVPSLKTGAASSIRQPFCSQLEERLLLWLEYHPLVKSYAWGDIGPSFDGAHRHASRIQDLVEFLVLVRSSFCQQASPPVRSTRRRDALVAETSSDRARSERRSSNGPRQSDKRLAHWGNEPTGQRARA